MNSQAFYLVPIEVISNLEKTQKQIVELLSSQKTEPSNGSLKTHLTAKEFMAAISISRSKFDQLVDSNLIKTIKKNRKIYVPITEVEHYFKENDSNK